MKQDLSWLKSIITNYQVEQEKKRDETDDPHMKFMHYGAMGACDDILDLIKDANELTEME